MIPEPRSAPPLLAVIALQEVLQLLLQRALLSPRSTELTSRDQEQDIGNKVDEQDDNEEHP